MTAKYFGQNECFVQKASPYLHEYNANFFPRYLYHQNAPWVICELKQRELFFFPFFRQIHSSLAHTVYYYA